jgi:CHAD domain-containing protein
MAYRIARPDQVDLEIRRLMCERLQQAVGHIDAYLDGEPAGIHETRKRIKEMRALLRLVQEDLGELQEREDQWFRERARALGDVRDAQAILESFDKLKAQQDAHLDVDLDAFHRHLVAQGEQALEADINLPLRLKALQADFEAAQARVALWPLHRCGFTLLQTGLQDIYRRGRRAMRGAYRKPSAIHFHAWRKRVKDHWYHSRLRESIWPAELQVRIEALKTLSDLLGDDHDLEMLRGAVERARLAEQERLLDLLDLRQAELRHEAAALGERLYAERPGSLRRRYAVYWRQWEREHVD